MSYALVVGSDSQDRAWIESTLLRGGLEVAAATEADVLAVGDLLPPRLVVMDDATHRDERLASLRRLQGHPALKGVPVVILAYEGDVESFTEAITKGVAAYLVKPTNSDCSSSRPILCPASWLSRSDSNTSTAAAGRSRCHACWFASLTAPKATGRFRATWCGRAAARRASA